MTCSVLEISKMYNALHELMSAADLLQSRPGEVIDPLLDIIVRYGLHDRVGIRLLHRHNQLEPSELMAETYVLDADGFAMITRAQSSADINAAYVPNSWIATASGWLPVEFSARELLADENINPEAYPVFFKDLSSELDRLGVADILGPSVLGSRLVEAHRPTGATILMEFTAVDDRANVLRFVAANETAVDGTAIETHWCVSGAEDEKEGEKVGTKACTRICPSIQNPPRHQGTYIHRQS